MICHSPGRGPSTEVALAAIHLNLDPGSIAEQEVGLIVDQEIQGQEGQVGHVPKHVIVVLAALLDHEEDPAVAQAQDQRVGGIIFYITLPSFYMIMFLKNLNCMINCHSPHLMNQC